MSIPQTLNETVRKPLRLWPGVVIAALLVVLRFVVPLLLPSWSLIGVLAGIACTVLLLLWWLFFSRAPWVERIGAVAVTAAAYFVVKPFLHESIAGGLQRRMFLVYAIPTFLPVAFVLWATATRRFSDTVRRATMAATILLACAVWTLVRTEGVSSEAIAEWRWRWTPTAEEKLLARGDDLPAAVRAPEAPHPAKGTAAMADAAAAGADKGTSRPTASAMPASGSPAGGSDRAAARAGGSTPSTGRTEGGERTTTTGAASSAVPRRAAAWPGFRGPDRDGVIRGLRIRTDWSASPPLELWRRAIGPGWSSFAVDGDLLYTQEQRGEMEVVTAYRLSNGEPVWSHRDQVRFYESNGGPGPRATPTLNSGRVYTLGATGIVNALDATNGAVVWTRNAQADTGAPLPGWGFAGSPLALHDLLIVATSGRLVGYDIATGNPRWVRATGGGGYSSPHLFTIDNVPQVVLVTGRGATSVSPSDGTVLWEHVWDVGTAIVQPAAADNGDLLIVTGDAMGAAGIRRLAVSRGPSGWTAQERWTSRGLKPYFNDYVVHKGHAFGFDGSILSCIDLSDGARKWKGGRYGQGQMVLLPDQNALLVLSEEGELALVSATPDRHTELARFKAIEGKTWNHPAVVNDVVLVRNGEEMAAFRLPVTGR